MIVVPALHFVAAYTEMSACLYVKEFAFIKTPSKNKSSLQAVSQYTSTLIAPTVSARYCFGGFISCVARTFNCSRQIPSQIDASLVACDRTGKGASKKIVKVATLAPTCRMSWGAGKQCLPPWLATNPDTGGISEVAYPLRRFTLSRDSRAVVRLEWGTNRKRLAPGAHLDHQEVFA